jgi:hypothetical protein
MTMLTGVELGVSPVGQAKVTAVVVAVTLAEERPPTVTDVEPGVR